MRELLVVFALTLQACRGGLPADLNDGGPVPTCGDGICDSAESSSTCPADCGGRQDAGNTDAGQPPSDAGLSPVSPTAPGQVSWIINQGAYTLLQGQGASATTLANQYFGNPKTYFVATAKTDLSTIPQGCIPTRSFTSYADIRNALSSGAVPAGIKAIMYDSENWSFTPVAEQLDPALYYKLAAQRVHQASLIFIAVPATDLVTSIEPGFTGGKYSEFVRLGIPGAAAQYADVYEVQAQGSEMSLALFADFVSRASAQAKNANPEVSVLAGISTNPTGQTVTSDQLFAAVRATLNTSVSGYWLNIPAASPYCPTCGTPQPQVAVGLLQDMLNNRP
jgi:hypothetical protein